MKTQTIRPSPQYLLRMRILTTLIALLIALGIVLLGAIISIDNHSAGGIVVSLVISLLVAVGWLGALLLTGPYYRSLSYEVQDDEVIVHAGIWTKSVKHVPYRTVTNLVVKRDVVDRMLGIGTLNIQTAGMSGQTGVEESLAGLTDVQSVYDTVAQELRRFRGGMAPTQTETEEMPIPASPDALNAILAEVRAIRQALEAES
jgi:uncharacterized membrane protein YdbT with pleckstrin-like domain